MKHSLQPHPALRWLGLLALLLGTLAAGSPARAQTITLILVQTIPLFLLPYLLLPWAGHNGLFDEGVMRTVADGLFDLALG